MSISEREENRTVLVTGAADGIGWCVAQTFAQAGYNLAALDLDRTKLETRCAELTDSHGVAALPIAVDVAQEEQVGKAVAEAVAAFGGIDVLINNAGIRDVAPIWETSTELWDRVMSVNLRGQFMVAREVLKQSMLSARHGKMVFISSVAGRKGVANSSAYGASKWGIRGLAACVAQDLKGTGINVTLVMPGRTDTPMARNSEKWDPDIGWLNPQAVANMVLTYCQQESDVEIPELYIHHSAEL